MKFFFMWLFGCKPLVMVDPSIISELDVKKIEAAGYAVVSVLGCRDLKVLC